MRVLGIALFLWPGLAAHGQVPFILPWNDSTPSFTDFSALNSPIGTNRVSVDAEGHFNADGKRVRFFGVNFAGDSPFMPTNNAEAVAARLAKFGVNAIRFHHMDAPWAYNGGLVAYTGTTSTNVSSAQLERVHYLVSRLKAHGIYSDINLLVGREYRSGDGLGSEVTGIDSKLAHVLAFFYDPALALQKDYATKVLTPTNRFTGLPLAKDPAVAFVEIINENGVLQKWFDGGLDALPTRYATNLQSRWNAWLAARYTNDATLQIAWKVTNQPLSTNYLANGAFSNALTGWNAEQHNNARASFARTYDFTNGQPSARIAVTNADTVDWYIQFNCAGLKLISNQAYTVSFWAKSEPATNISASVMQAHADWLNLGYNPNFALTTNWQMFSNTFQATASETNARVGFSSMGNKLATFWYADVRFQAGGQLGTVPPGTSLASRNLPNISHSAAGYSGTQEARRDWLRFLRDLEYKYYDAIVSHIRTNIGYTGLIFGTIVANSPATVQSRLDVIDAHAYWQHPQLPGTPWDPVNWFQPNISMVNTVGVNNTLAGLARQRIQGKPFTVTEYEHPSPNYHGAEAPLLLAAYAGLQDWDGLWLFAYGPGNDSYSMGYVRGYFEIAQHPNKVANLLLAANLFRRGDVRPARQEICMALTPDAELDQLRNASAWSVFSSSQLGVPAGLAFTNRLSVAVGTNAVGLTAAPSAPAGSVLTSDTGELRWDLSLTNKGLVTVDTPRTKALVGFADNRSVAFGGMNLRPGMTQLGWCTLGATLTRGEVFTNDCALLVVASGWWENTGQIWTDTNKISVANQWGHSPVLTEVVPFALTLPVGTNFVQAWSLDERGQRKDSLAITGTATNATLTVATNAGSIWYEMDVSRWTATYDLWRARYFSASEQTNSLISGIAAKPDDDALPNLLKYYLGLPGHTAASTNSKPQGTLLSLNGERYLAFTFTHDKLVADVDCVAEVSTDLIQWNSGAAYTKVEQTQDLGGSQESITVRDLTPAGVATARFMRLRFQQH